MTPEDNLPPDPAPSDDPPPPAEPGQSIDEPLPLSPGLGWNQEGTFTVVHGRGTFPEIETFPEIDILERRDLDR